MFLIFFKIKVLNNNNDIFKNNNLGLDEHYACNSYFWNMSQVCSFLNEKNGLDV